MISGATETKAEADKLHQGVIDEFKATILTGRNSWLLEEAANHVPYFPEKFITFPEVLKNRGYKTGKTGKGWAPGVALKNGQKRNWVKVSGHKDVPGRPALYVTTKDFLNDLQSELDTIFNMSKV